MSAMVMQRADRAASAFWHWLVAFGLLALGLALLRPTVAGIDDVTWLIEVAERMLDGQRLYVDVLETNPPASVWLYLPAVGLARILGVSSEFLVDAQTYVCAALSLSACAAILGRASLLDSFNRPWLLVSAAAILTLLPNGVFGQREHFVLMALLPMLSVLAARAAGVPGALVTTVFAALAAGCGLAIKPHYALCLAPAMLVAAWSQNAWHPWPSALRQALFSVETLVMAAVIALYAGLVAWFQPEFFERILPAMAMVYVPVRLTPLQFATHPAMLIWAGALVSMVLAARQRIAAPPLSLLALASAGAMLAFVLQGKGFMYQAYPMLALALAGGMLAVLDKHGTSTATLRMLALGALLVMGQASWKWFGAAWDSIQLREVLARIQPSPRFLAISSELSVGHPLVRQVGGTWLSREPCLWNIKGGLERKEREQLDPATLAQIDAYGKSQRDILLEDIRNGRPDIVLVQIALMDWSKWAAADAEISAELAAFENRGTYDGVQVLQRRQLR